MAEAARDGRTWVLVEHHCPICAAATACQGFCRNELALFRSVLPGTRVERTEYLLDGGQRCAYRIESSD
jgi:predicted ArsR family transcriptional regulator